MKSSNTFCFLCRMPARCHSSPYSPPPRRLATAKTPPASSHGKMPVVNVGRSLTLKPP